MRERKTVVSKQDVAQKLQHKHTDQHASGQKQEYEEHDEEDEGHEEELNVASRR